MTSCRQQIRSFVLGIIVWGVLVMFLKSFKKTEAFGASFTDNDKQTWDWKNLYSSGFDGSYGSTGSDNKIPGWGSGGEHGSRIETENELKDAEDLIAAIDESTKTAIGKIKAALVQYEEARASAGSNINELVTEHKNYAQGMITALDDSLQRAGMMLRDKKADLENLYESVKTMAETGGSGWDKIQRRLHNAEGHDPTEHETFRQPRRRRSGNVPSPSVAATSLGN